MLASLLPATTARPPAAGTRAATALAIADASTRAPAAALRSARLAKVACPRLMDKIHGGHWMGRGFQALRCPKETAVIGFGWARGFRREISCWGLGGT